MGFFSQRAAPASGSRLEPASRPARSGEDAVPHADTDVFPVDPLVWQQEVAVAAYYRWLERGGHDGADQEDWYEAEADLSKRKRSS